MRQPRPTLMTQMPPRLFLPTARQTNWLLVIGFLALGEALYLRYLAIEYATVALACQAGLETWLCTTFRLPCSTLVFVDRAVRGLAQPAAALDRPGVDRLGGRQLRPGIAQCRFARSRSHWSSAWRVRHPHQSDRQRDQARAKPSACQLATVSLKTIESGRSSIAAAATSAGRRPS